MEKMETLNVFKLTKKEFFSLEIFKAMLGNDSLTSYSSVEELIGHSVKAAGELLEKTKDSL